MPGTALGSAALGVLPKRAPVTRSAGVAAITAMARGAIANPMPRAGAGPALKAQPRMTARTRREQRPEPARRWLRQPGPASAEVSPRRVAEAVRELRGLQPVAPPPPWARGAGAGDDGESNVPHLANGRGLLHDRVAAEASSDADGLTRSAAAGTCFGDEDSRSTSPSTIAATAMRASPQIGERVGRSLTTDGANPRADSGTNSSSSLLLSYSSRTASGVTPCRRKRPAARL
jgi:hypothetical protein